MEKNKKDKNKMSNDVLWIYFLIVNTIAFVTVVLDKNKAKQSHFRVPEKYFFILSIVGGALGVYLGMQLFRHKTQHRWFIYGIPLLIIVNLVMLYLVIRKLYII